MIFFFWILAVVLVGAWSWVLVQYFSLRRANVELADRYADTVRNLDSAHERVMHLEHEYNPDVTDARTAQYVKVLDTVRQNINLDVRMLGPVAGPMMLGGKPWAGPGGGDPHLGPQGLEQLVHSNAGVVDLNRRVERVHSAMKQLAAFFEEEDPCPCSRCTVNRTMKAHGVMSVSDIMKIGNIPPFPAGRVEPQDEQEDAPPPPPRPGKFDLPPPFDPNKLRGDL